MQYLKNLPDDIDGVHYSQYMTDSQDLTWLFKMVALPEDYHKDITAAMVYCYDGDILSVFLSESGRYYDINSLYRPLTFYRPENWSINKLPEYWQDSNEYYI